MSYRYEDRYYDRDEEDYGRRDNSEYGRSYGERPNARYRSDENERYGGARSGGEYGGRYSSGQDRERGRYSGQGQGNFGESGGRYSERESGYGEYGDRYSSGRQGGREIGNSGGRYSSMRGGYGGEGYDQNRWENNRGYSSYRDRDTGNYDRGYGEGRYNQGSYSQGYNYPRSTNRETYRGRDWSDYDRGQYGREQEGRYESDRGERGWWDRTSDEVASWFGDREAEQRRQMDRQRQFSGRGPKGYRRSDERIKEDVNDRLSEGYLDASEIEVAVSNSEVTLTGSVNTRQDKRRAEDIAESVSGVTHVENRLRVTQSSLDRPALGTTSARQGTNASASMGGSTGVTGSSGDIGTSTSGTSTSAAASSRGKSAGS